MATQYVTRFSQTILAEPKLAVEACKYALQKFRTHFPEVNPTLSTTDIERLEYSSHEGYKLYNFFSAAAPNRSAIRIFRELKDFVFSNCDDDSLYIQAWLNSQKSNHLLDWHRHNGYLFHGYICVDPKNTVTEFETFTIENEPGLMYLGECGEMHRVIKRQDFLGERMTIGFDVVRPASAEFLNLGFIPIFRN